ncbi:MAG: hypothetical protein IJ347_02155 [Faecalibacterium sp.]|nr:hypothetical protein [Faecalibacterium sp.]
MVCESSGAWCIRRKKTDPLSILSTNFYVTTAVNAENRRYKNVFITEKSRLLAAPMLQRREQVENGLMKGFSSEEKEKITALLLHLRKNVEEM